MKIRNLERKSMLRNKWLLIALFTPHVYMSCGLLQDNIRWMGWTGVDNEHLFSPSDSLIISFNELTSLLPTAKSGTVFLIKNGTYKDINLTLRKNHKAKVKVKAQNEGKVIIQGKSSFRIADTEYLSFSGFLFDQVLSRDIVILSNSKHVEIANNYFERCGSEPNGKIIRIENGSSNNSIYRNTFVGNRSAGVVIVTDYDRDIGNTNNTIHYNFFYDIPSVREIYEKGNNGLEAVQLGQGIERSNLKLNTHINNNLFEKVIGDGSEIISIKASNNEVFNNTFLNSRSGLTIRFGENNKISNNYLKNTTQGIRVFGYGHSIINNFIEDCAMGIQLPAANFSRRQRPSSSGYYQQDNLRIENNTIVNPGTAAFVIGNQASSENNRTLMPRKVALISNTVYNVSEKAIDYQYPENFEVNSLRREGNETVRSRSDVNPRAASRSATTQRENLEPLGSKDRKVGAAWKRP